jgi:uncharacterized protein YukE
MQNFMGKDGMTWWYGVVEDTDDPLKVGRCKVRIFGWHSENLQEMPTKELPWAAIMTSTNTSKAFSPPRLGDYVMGFFSDGMSGQAPVIMGVLPGLEPTQVDKAKGFSPQSALKPATPPSGQTQYTPGQPTTAPLARGIVENTAIAKTNNDRVHVCDITGPLRYSIAFASLKIGQAIQAIRAALTALWAGTSSSPFADEVRNIIKAIKAKIKLVQKFIKNVTEKLSVIQDVIKQLQQLVAYISNLPAKLAAMLKQCLADATASLKDAITNSKSIVDSQSTGVIADAATTITTTTATLASASIVATSSAFANVSASSANTA